jgi:hypothetical protein
MTSLRIWRVGSFIDFPAMTSFVYKWIARPTRKQKFNSFLVRFVWTHTFHLDGFWLRCTYIKFEHKIEIIVIKHIFLMCLLRSPVESGPCKTRHKSEQQFDTIFNAKFALFSLHFLWFFKVKAIFWRIDYFFGSQNSQKFNTKALNLKKNGGQIASWVF